VELRLPAIGAIFAAVGLSACDPEVHIAWQKQFDGKIDPSCISSALKSVSPKVLQNTYISSGDRGFPKGTSVTQFGYPDPVGYGYYNIDVAAVGVGKTSYWHGWSKVGTDIPAGQRMKILPTMSKANRAVAAACELSFDDVIPEQGAG
jgi:hypothetical protein